MAKKKLGKTSCRTPTPGKQPTNIDTWKYEVVRKAILNVIPKRGEGVFFKDLTDLVANRLSADDQMKIGSLPWYVTVVKLELEVSGELKRVKGASPQRLVRA